MRVSTGDAALADRLGYSFRDQALLGLALTHVSLHVSDRKGAGSYQRLEFLGDRVLGLVVSAMLYREFPAATEGELSRRLASLVRRETCAAVAVEWALGPLIRLGEGERVAGGRKKPAILADVCEALIGATYLDGGLEAAEALVKRGWAKRMRDTVETPQDAKTALQEWAQGLGKATPSYREVARSGPAHAPSFTVSVAVEGLSEVEGTGPSKRVAEQAAAAAFLREQRLVGKEEVAG